MGYIAAGIVALLVLWFLVRWYKVKQRRDKIRAWQKLPKEEQGDGPEGFSRGTMKKEAPGYSFVPYLFGIFRHPTPSVSRMSGMMMAYDDEVAREAQLAGIRPFFRAMHTFSWEKDDVPYSQSENDSVFQNVLFNTVLAVIATPIVSFALYGLYGFLTLLFVLPYLVPVLAFTILLCVLLYFYRKEDKDSKESKARHRDWEKGLNKRKGEPYDELD